MTMTRHLKFEIIYEISTPELPRHNFKFIKIVCFTMLVLGLVSVQPQNQGF